MQAAGHSAVTPDQESVSATCDCRLHLSSEGGMQGDILRGVPSPDPDPETSTCSLGDPMYIRPAVSCGCQSFSEVMDPPKALRTLQCIPSPPAALLLAHCASQSLWCVCMSLSALTVPHRHPRPLNPMPYLHRLHTTHSTLSPSTCLPSPHPCAVPRLRIRPAVSHLLRDEHCAHGALQHAVLLPQPRLSLHLQPGSAVAGMGVCIGAG